MGIGKAGIMLAPALFVLNLPVVLARAPGKIAYGSGGRVEDFACVDVGNQTNKSPLPVTPLAVPVMETVLVM